MSHYLWNQWLFSLKSPLCLSFKPKALTNFMNCLLKSQEKECTDLLKFNWCLQVVSWTVPFSFSSIAFIFRVFLGFFVIIQKVFTYFHRNLFSPRLAFTFSFWSLYQVNMKYTSFLCAFKTHLKILHLPLESLFPFMSLLRWVSFMT